MLFSRIKLPFRTVVKLNLTDAAAILLLYGSIYLKDWASQWLSSSVAIVFLMIGLIIGGVSLFKNSENYISINAGVVAVLLFVFLICTLVFKGIINTSSYYISIPCAIIIVSLAPRFFIKILVVHFAITTCMEIFEYFTNQYIFVYTADDGVELDQDLFGGYLGVFRAKGMFQGPLSAVAFGIWMAFLFRGSLINAVMLFLGAFFASGRLGMFVGFIIFFFRAIENGLISLIKFLPWIILAITSSVVLLVFSDEDRLLFIISAFDLGNDQNVSRIDFWWNSLAIYISYDPINLLLGDYGFIRKTQGGTENDFLGLLLDCGFLGFLLYFFAVLCMIVKAVEQKDREGILIALTIPILMNIFPFVQSLSSAVLFWIYFFYVMDHRSTNSF